MSRVMWVAVGAVGGIYAYRRGQRALDEAKARGFVGNVQVAAGTAASVAQGVSKVAALAAGQPATPSRSTMSPPLNCPQACRSPGAAHGTQSATEAGPSDRSAPRSTQSR